MRKIIVKALLLTAVCLSGRSQTPLNGKELASIKSQVSIVHAETGKLQSKIEGLYKANYALSGMIDSLKQQVYINSSEIAKTGQVLNSKILETGIKSDEKFTVVRDSLSKKTLYWIIAFLLTTIAWILLYLLLSRRQKTDKSAIVEQLSQAKSSIEANLITEFGKQTQLMETQLQYMDNQAKLSFGAVNGTTDHSLAIKVADEINLIERNLNLMDSKTKGLKQIMASIGKLKDNMAANNYEMPELLGKPFHQGMKVIVTNSIPDSNLAKGEEKISKIIKPQVNFNDKMIQTAQIEVSIGY